MRPLLLLLLLLCAPALAQTYPPQPADGLIADTANLLDADTRAQIDQLTSTLLAEKQIPIVVVTIPSLAHHQAHAWTIERYAGALFNTWGIGSPDYDYGILLLISPGDRKARIELGRAWARDYDPESRTIMDELIIPAFKQDDYPAGILAGVQGLNAMARGQTIPRRPVLARTGDLIRHIFAWFRDHLFLAGFALLFLTLSILKRLGIIESEYHISFDSSGRSSGRSYSSSSSGFSSGGGFSGGSSGGGGATGSW